MSARSWAVVALASLVSSLALAAGPEPSAAALRDQAKAMFGVVAPVRSDEVEAPQAVLGRALFWDTRLSLDGKTACASCHATQDHSADRRRFSINAKGKPTTLHSQPIFMAQDQVALRWYGDRRDGAHQADRSITGSMGFADVKDLAPLLKALDYEAAFRAAFPAQAEPLTPANYAQALQTYQRSLRTPARFDTFLQGDNSALSRQELVGLRTFIANGCAGCHSGPLLGGSSMQKFGLLKEYWLATGSSPVDQGRFNATKQDADKYVYRVPMLRNVAKTAPYFHDGSVDRIEDAVRIMAEVQLGRTLSEADIADITAFLGSLTGDVPEHYAPPAARTAARP